MCQKNKTINLNLGSHHVQLTASTVSKISCSVGKLFWGWDQPENCQNFRNKLICKSHCNKCLKNKVLHKWILKGIQKLNNRTNRALFRQRAILKTKWWIWTHFPLRKNPIVSGLKSKIRLFQISYPQSLKDL